MGDVGTLLPLAVAAERHGWDGVHLWDHPLHDEPDWPVASPVVAASATAAATGRQRILLLVGRWRVLRHITASPSRIGDIAKAALVLTHFEHGYLPR